MRLLAHVLILGMVLASAGCAGSAAKRTGCAGAQQIRSGTGRSCVVARFGGDGAGGGPDFIQVSAARVETRWSVRCPRPVRDLVFRLELFQYDQDHRSFDARYIVGTPLVGGGAGAVQTATRRASFIGYSVSPSVVWPRHVFLIRPCTWTIRVSAPIA